MLMRIAMKFSVDPYHNYLFSIPMRIAKKICVDPYKNYFLQWNRQQHQQQQQQQQQQQRIAATDHKQTRNCDFLRIKRANIAFDVAPLALPLPHVIVSAARESLLLCGYAVLSQCVESVTVCVWLNLCVNEGACESVRL